MCNEMVKGEELDRRAKHIRDQLLTFYFSGTATKDEVQDLREHCAKPLTSALQNRGVILKS